MSGFRTRLSVRPLEPRSLPALVTWDGGAGTFNWADAANWSANKLPTAADDVEIDAPGHETITYSGGASGVASLKLADSLRITGGSLTVAGKLTVEPNYRVSAEGATRAFQVNGAVSANGASFAALNGGRVTLTQLTAYDGLDASYPQMLASGATSQVELPNLTGVRAAGGAYVAFTAESGGTITAAKLANLFDPADKYGGFFAYATGAGSAIDLTALKSAVSPEHGVTALDASFGGGIIAPALTQLHRGQIGVDSVSTLATAQFTELKSASLNLTGGAHPFPALTDFTGCSIYAYGGAVVTVPLAQHSGNTAIGTEFRAIGAGSSITFPNLMTLDVPDYHILRFSAYEGGLVSLPQMSEYDSRSLIVTASGADSVVHLPALTKLLTAEFVTSGVTAEAGGKVHVPLLTTATRTTFILADPASTLNLNGFTSADYCSFFAINGAKLALPGLTSYMSSQNVISQFGAYSQAELSFPNLANWIGPDYSNISIQAYDGSVVHLPLITTFEKSAPSITASGTASVIDLPQLTNLDMGAFGYATVNVRDGGKVHVPLLTTATRTAFILADPASTLDLTALTSAHTCSFQADGAAKFVLPGITAYGNPESTASFTAYNQGVLTFPNLTQFQGPDFGQLSVQAYNGGIIELPLITELTAGQYSIFATGDDSVVHLPVLAKIVMDDGHVSSVQAANGGKVHVPLLTTAKRATFVLDGANSILDLSALTSAHTCSFQADGAAKFVLPGIAAYKYSESGASFTAYSQGVLTFPNLTQLQGPDFGQLVVQSYGGGVVELPLITELTAGQYSIAAYSGGRVSLPALAGITDVRASIGAYGETSKAELPLLNKITTASPYRSFVTAGDGGAVLVPVLATAVRTEFNLIGANAKLDLAALTNANGSGFHALYGGELVVPVLQAYDGLAVTNAAFTAYGIGSKLTFTALQTLVGPSDSYLYIDSTEGALISMPAATQVPAGYLWVQVNDAALSMPSMTSISPAEPGNAFINLVGQSTLTFAPQVALGRTELRIHPDATVVTGQLTLQAGARLTGRGLLSAALINGGEVRPDGPQGDLGGLITVIGSYTQQAGGKLSIDVYETADGKYDQLAVVGSVVLGGVLALSVGYDAKPGDSYVFLANDGVDPIVGQFANLNPGQVINLFGNDYRVSLTGGSGNDGTLTRLPTPPSVLSPVIGDGSSQRSVVRSITYTFTDVVNLPADPSEAFAVIRTGPGGTTGPVGVKVDTSLSTPAFTVAKLTFTGPLTEFGSWIDGTYTVTLIGSKITDGFGRQLDGDGDGQQGGDKIAETHRLFGDFNGDRSTNFADFLAFRGSFGLKSSQAGYLPAFDFDNDNDVDFVDFLAFRGRFGVSL